MPTASARDRFHGRRDRFLRLGAGVVAVMMLLSASGCSISDSVSESSESFSASSRSISDSSSPESKEAKYRQDVREYTAAYVKSGGQIAEFDRKLGDLARAQGISNWEDNMATYEGIGQGLRKAQVGPVALSAYVDNLAGQNREKAQAIRRGYDSAAP